MPLSLTPRERVIRALAFEETDLVPYHLMIDAAVVPRLANYYHDVDFEERIENHLPFINLDPAIRYETADEYIDSFGCRWRSGVFPHLEKPALDEPSLKGYQFPELVDANTFVGVEGFFARYDRHFTLCGLTHGYFDRGWALRGMENFLGDFIEKPAFIEELFETLAHMYLGLIDRICDYPFEGIRFGDDWGYQRGVIVGAKRWRKFVKPGIRKIFQHARDKGLVVMVHSDGNIAELIPDLIDMGVQILNPVQPEAMDIVAVKREFGRSLCLNGGVSTQFTLPRGSAEDVRREVEACLMFLGKGGGFVLSPAKAIMEDVPLENAAALIDSMVHQNRSEGRMPGEDVDGYAAALQRVYAEFHPNQANS